MRRTGWVAVVLLLSGCGDGDTDGAGPRCVDVYADGASVDQAVEVDNSTGCADGNQIRFFGFATLDCADGRVLRWNDEGWGYDDGTWHRHAGSELVAPADERNAC